MNEKLKSLKAENVIKVFNKALDKVRTSRSDLERETGLSFVTVSKIADALVELGVLRQSFTKDTVQIRKSRLLSTKFYYWIGIYTFENHLFTFSILDLSLRTKHRMIFIPPKEEDVDYSVNRFLKAVERFVKKHKKNHPCIGTCALVNGFYNEEKDKVTSSDIKNFEYIRLKELLSSYSFNTDPVVKCVFYEYIKYTQSILKDGESVFTMFLNRGNMLSAYITKTSNAESALAQTGVLRAYDNKTLNTITELPPAPDTFLSALADLAFTLLFTVPYSRITICGNLYSRMDSVAIVLKYFISMRCERTWTIPPDVSSTDQNALASLHISREMRNSWLENLLK